MRLIVTRFLLVGLVATGLAVGPGAEALVEIKVTTSKDVVNGGDGKCSLREAVTAAQEAEPSGQADGECPAGEVSGTNLIKLKRDTTYELTRNGDTDENGNADGDLDFLSGFIKVRGAKKTTIVQRVTDQRVIDVIGGSVALERVKITGGHAQAPGGDPGEGWNGGGIRNASALDLFQATVTGNRAGSAPPKSVLPGGSGGGIYNTEVGTLTVRFSKIVNNSAGNGTSGAAPSFAATAGGNGGGIYNGRFINMSDSKVLNNRAGNGGSGASTGSFLNRYGANGGHGGGIASVLQAGISRSTLAGTARVAVATAGQVANRSPVRERTVATAATAAGAARSMLPTGRCRPTPPRSPGTARVPAARAVRAGPAAPGRKMVRPGSLVSVASAEAS